MSDHILDLPFIAHIPYSVQIDENISDAAKIFFGQICGLSIKYGYIFATDEQLAQMKKTEIRNIQRWMKELEENGHLTRLTNNEHVKQEDGSYRWIKKRKIFIGESFSKKVCEHAKNVAFIEHDKNVHSNEHDKNVHYKVAIQDNKGILQPELASSASPVVVFSSLEKLDIKDTLKQKICAEHSEDAINLAVERCLRWKSRSSDEVGILYALKNAENWVDILNETEVQEKNTQILNSLKHLDMKTSNGVQIFIGPNYVEFFFSGHCSSKRLEAKDKDFELLLNQALLNYNFKK